MTPIRFFSKGKSIQSPVQSHRRSSAFLQFNNEAAAEAGEPDVESTEIQAAVVRPETPFAREVEELLDEMDSRIQLGIK